MSALTNTERIRDILFRGKPALHDIKEKVTAAGLDMSTTQASELSFEISDPGFKILNSGRFAVDTPVSYRGLPMTISVLETTSGGGQGGLSVKCRSSAIKRLKDLRGAHVVKDATPSSYVIAECKLAGVKYVVQPSSAKRHQIARDIPQKGQEYDNTNHPSAWTTFQRMATDAGYIMYEVGGTIYFGQPTWLVARSPKVTVEWYPENGKEPYTIPQFRQSTDSRDVEVSVELPIDRAGTIFPGYGISFTDFPVFSGVYLITQVSYPLAGVGNISVTASTLRNPKPTPVNGKAVSGGGE